MADRDDSDSLKRDALKIGLTMLTTDVRVRVEALERKLGLHPGDASHLDLERRMARIEEEILRLCPSEAP